jgi:hypothetical protein
MSKIQTKNESTQVKSDSKTIINYVEKIEIILKKIDRNVVEKVINTQEEYDKDSIILYFKNKILGCGIPKKILEKSNFNQKIDLLIENVMIDFAINNLDF